MTDKAYTFQQVETIKNNLEAIAQRLDALSKPSSRFGELEAYPLGFSLLPCGKVPPDREGMVINGSMKLLSDEALSILNQFVECQQQDPQDDPTENEECDRLFSLIEDLNIDIDYDRIKQNNKECCDETKRLIVDLDNDLVQVSNNIDSGFAEIKDRANNIDGRINTVNNNLSAVNTNITTVLEGISQLLLCPCNENIINQIRLKIEELKTNIDVQLNNLSIDISNINVDGAEVDIDYQPIFNKFTELGSTLQQYQTSIISNENNWGNSIIAAVQGNSAQLSKCCNEILKTLDNLSFDLSPVFQAIESSKVEILQAFSISEGKIISNITDTRQAVLTGQTDIKTIISAKIDSYLGKDYNGQIIVHDKEGNQLAFPFAGIGLDGILNIILLLAEILDKLLNQEEDPCNSIALIYSDYYPHKVLRSQLHITFIPANEKKLARGVPNKTMHVFNPRENIDWCRDIEPIRPHQGTSGFLRLAWDQDRGSGTVKSWTGGHFFSKSNAIDTASKLMALSTLADADYRWTEEGTKKDVKTILWRPISAVLVYVNNGQVTNLRCFSAPKDGC